MEEIHSPGYLPMVSHNELIDKTYTGKEAVITDLLYTGGYILAGAHKNVNATLILDHSDPEKVYH